MSWQTMVAPLHAEAHPGLLPPTVGHLRGGLLGVSAERVEKIEFTQLAATALLGCPIREFRDYAPARTIVVDSNWIFLRQPTQMQVPTWENMPSHDRVEQVLAWVATGAAFPHLKAYAEAVLNHAGTRLHSGIWDILVEHLTVEEMGAHQTMHALGAQATLPARLASL